MKTRSTPRRLLMATLGSLSSSLLLPNPALRPLRSPSPSPNPNPRLPPLRFKSRVRAGADAPSRPPPPADKKSLAVATGEFFLGIASLFLGNSFGSAASAPASAPPPAEEYFERRRASSAAPEVVWEQRWKDVEAERERRTVTSPGFSFSAAGLLFPYHLGVAQLLLERGYIKETTPLAGSSAGAIVCAAIASNNTMQDALEVTKTLADNCRLKGTAFRLGAVLRDVLDKFLPDDVHVRCSGRVRVAITQLLWRPRGLLVDQFDSKKDLIDAVFTSSFIPGYLAPRPATIFRNRLCIDGGLTLFMPPTAASQTVRVCAFPFNHLGVEGIAISPHCNPAEDRATARQLFNWALEPAEDHILDQLYELGYLDAAVWADQNPIESTVKDEEEPSIN